MSLASRSVALCLALAAGTSLVTAASAASASDRAATARATADADQAELVDRGRALFATGCASCHGTDGRGVRLATGQPRGPSLVGAGEAAATYYLTTGRMPLANSGDVPQRKEPAYGREDIRALVAFVAGLGPGPSLPDLDLAAADEAAGGVDFRVNCQACHSATGAGGALSYGRSAPPLHQATPEQVAAAVRSGPGEMPRFGAEQLPDDELADIAAYVQYLRRPDDRGGLPLGRLGPVPEGLFVWTVALGVLLVVCVWIGGRRPRPTPTAPPPEVPDARA